MRTHAHQAYADEKQKKKKKKKKEMMKKSSECERLYQEMKSRASERIENTSNNDHTEQSKAIVAKPLKSVLCS